MAIVYKIIGIEPWVNGNVNMQRLYCVFKKDGTVGLACIACSIESSRMPSDVSVDSFVYLGFGRNSKYLDFVLLSPTNNTTNNI